jgi:hypothetical protein
MKIVTYGNISLDEYKNTSFAEECELIFESIEIPTEIDFLNDNEELATEGIWDITKGVGNTITNTYNIAKTTTKGATQLAGTILRKSNDMLRFFNNQLKKALPRIVESLRKSLEQLEITYMKLTKFDGRLKEIAIRATNMINTKSYERINTIQPMTIRFYHTQARVFKEIVDIVGDYHYLCHKVCGIQLDASKIYVQTNNDVIFTENNTGAKLIAPSDLMDKVRELTKVRDKVNLEEIARIIGIAQKSVEAYNGAMTKYGENSILRAWIEKEGNSLGLPINFLNLGSLNTKSRARINESEKKKGINPLKYALIPDNSTITFNPNAWRDQKAKFINMVDAEPAQGGMVKSFVALINGQAGGQMQKSTISVLVDLVRKGGASVKKHTDILNKTAKKEIDELIAFSNGLSKYLTSEDQTRINAATQNDAARTSAGRQVVQADTGIGGNAQDNIGATKGGNDQSKVIHAISTGILSYMSGWYSIIFKLNSFYSQCSTGLLSAVFDITNEVDSCCTMVENGNVEQQDGFDQARNDVKETAPATDTDDTGGFFNG